MASCIDCVMPGYLADPQLMEGSSVPSTQANGWEMQSVSRDPMLWFTPWSPCMPGGEGGFMHQARSGAQVCSEKKPMIVLPGHA